jgi:hypothetical protein
MHILFIHLAHVVVGVHAGAILVVDVLGAHDLKAGEQGDDGAYGVVTKLVGLYGIHVDEEHYRLSWRRRMWSR